MAEPRGRARRDLDEAGATPDGGRLPPAAPGPHHCLLPRRLVVAESGGRPSNPRHGCQQPARREPDVGLVASAPGAAAGAGGLFGSRVRADGRGHLDRRSVRARCARDAAGAAGVLARARRPGPARAVAGQAPRPGRARGRRAADRRARRRPARGLRGGTGSPAVCRNREHPVARRGPEPEAAARGHVQLAAQSRGCHRRRPADRPDERGVHRTDDALACRADGSFARYAHRPRTRRMGRIVGGNGLAARRRPDPPVRGTTTGRESSPSR